MSGFIYIWYDRKNKRYYVGSHWGNDDDGYVCSSTWMRNSYRRRPQDFKRRIISRVSESREALLDEEQRWLDMMKDNELHGVRYYNHLKNSGRRWHTDPTDDSYKEIIEKIGASSRGKPRAGTWRDPEARSKNISVAVAASYISEERDENGKISRLSKQMSGRTVITRVETQECKRVKDHDLQSHLEDGWRLGRPDGWMKGEDNPNLGSKREKKECSKCGGFFPVNTLSRWHGENCRRVT